MGTAPVFNVKDYGAVGDGSTNDTTAIQNAINASSPGDVVYYPAGTYLVSSTIKLLKSRTYQGAGREYSVVKMANSANLDAVMASETWLSTTSTSADNPINVLDLKIDGNKANQSSGLGVGLALITYWNTVQNLEVVDCRGDGILVTSMRDDTTEISNTAVEAKVVRCAVRQSGGIGIHVQDPSPSTQSVTDGFILDCIVDTTGAEGIYIGSAAGWLVRGNHIYGASNTAIYLDRGGFTRVEGNYIETWGTNASAGTYCGIMCGGDGSSELGASGGMIFANNTMFYSGGAASGSSIRGIRVDVSTGVTGHVAIVGNSLSGATQATGSRGIRLTNQAAGTTLVAQLAGNVVYGWDAQFETATGGGTITIKGDIFRTGISTSATDGFQMLPTCAGTPTGTPGDLSRGQPMIYDTTNHKLWVYDAAWRGVTLT